MLQTYKSNNGLNFFFFFLCVWEGTIVLLVAVGISKEKIYLFTVLTFFKS